MHEKSVLLDTSFFIRLLNDEDVLHINTIAYYKYLLDHHFTLQISTITIAEYCVRGQMSDLPLGNLQVLPFNIAHAVRAGEFAKTVFTEKKIQLENLQPRAIIPNDSKLMAQADVENSIQYYLTSDTRSEKIFRILKDKLKLNFEFVDIAIPHNQTFGLLGLPDSSNG
jgi:predicted nucleic acid-binding protein